MPKRVDEVRLRMDLLSGIESASIREGSLVWRSTSCGGVGGDEGEESVEVGVRS